MTKSIVVTCLWILSLSVGMAQEVQTFSLKEAVNYSYEHHLNMKLAENKVKTAEQQKIETRSIGLPQLNAGVEYSHFLKIPTTLIPAQFFDPMAPEGEFAEASFGTKNNLTASATLSSLLFDGTYLTALKASKVYTNFARLDYENDRTQLRDVVKQAYLPPLLIQENIKTIQENIAVLEKLHHETNEMYKEGFVEKLDVDKLELSLDNMRTTLEDLQKAYNLAMNALKLQIGFPLSTELNLSESIEELSTPLVDYKESDAVDYLQRSAYRLLEQNKELQELNVERYKKGYWPSLTGFLTYQQVLQGENLFDNPSSSPTSIVGLKLNVPIFDGFYKKAKIAQAKITLENVFHQQSLLKSGIDLQVKMAHSNYKNALAKINSRKRNVELAERIFEITQIKYREGLGSSLEIIQAEQSLYQSQQNHIQALYDFILAKIDLEIAYGKE